MTVLSRSRPVHLYQMTRPADDRQQEARQEDPRRPPHLHNIERYFTVTSSEQKITVKNVYCAPLKAQNKTTAKITLLTALKAQKKPATKKHVSRHIKKPQKTSKYSRSPRPVGIESVNFYHVLKCAFFGDKSARKNHTIKDSLPDIIPVKYISS